MSIGEMPLPHTYILLLERAHLQLEKNSPSLLDT